MSFLGKSRKTGRIPQPEAKGKQVNWAKSWEISHKAPIGFGRDGDSEAFRGSCTAFCVG